VGAKLVSDSPDAVIALVAARQHGVVSLTQLRDAGIHRSGVQRRLHAGRLHRIYRGVYAVGHAGLSSEARWLAAVLACGPGAALSHRSAAELWGMLEISPGPVHVTVPEPGGRKQREDIRVHRSPSLLKAVTTRRKAIAVTTPARTLSDLRSTISPGLLRRARRQAEFLGLPIGEHARNSDGTRSDLEGRFLRLCRRHRLPEPEVNIRIGPYTVDFLWREQRLVVEIDAYVSHRGEQAFEDDRQRDNDLMGRGFEVRRFTNRKVDGDPGSVASLVRARLSEREN
jgi:very-short-patch-repair endonuclease